MRIDKIAAIFVKMPSLLIVLPKLHCYLSTSFDDNWYLALNNTHWIYIFYIFKCNEYELMEGGGGQNVFGARVWRNIFDVLYSSKLLLLLFLNIPSANKYFFCTHAYAY